MSSVLVDTSVWIEYLQHKNQSVISSVNLLLDQKLVTTCKTVQGELLPYFADENQFLKYHLIFACMTLCDERLLDWDAIVHYAFLLRKKGVTGFGIADLMIAQLSIQYDCYIFTLDGDFENLGAVMPIKLIKVG